MKGELEKTLDVKNAKPGDRVVLKTTEQAITSHGVVLPKGPKIVGHVVEADPKGNTNAGSRRTLQFEQAEVKDGSTMAVRTVLQSVVPPNSDAPHQQVEPSAARISILRPQGGSAVISNSNASARTEATSASQADNTIA